MVAVKTECWAFCSLPRQATFVIAPKKTTCTPEGPDLGKLLGNLFIKSKEAKLLEGGMTKAVVPSHELGPIIGHRERVLLVLLKRRRWIEGEGGAAKDTGMLRSRR